MKRTNLVCSIVTQLFCRTFISYWIHSYPTKNKTVQATMKVCKSSCRQIRNPGFIRTDASLESIRACEDLCWNHDKSTPYRSDTSGIVENAVRRIEEGTSLCSSGSVGSIGQVVEEKQWNASVTSWSNYTYGVNLVQRCYQECPSDTF